MSVPNYEKRRPPQNPMDGKGEDRYSHKVGSATDSMESHDVQDFDRKGWPGKRHKDVQSAINPVSVIANFSRLGEGLKRTGTFMEVAKQIAGIAEMAEATVMDEAGDWYDQHTIKRNMSELKKHAGSFVKLAQEMDMMQQRSTALYDDMGNVLSRYFELAPLQNATGEPFGDKKAPEFDGPGGNPADDEGRKKHDAQDGVLDDGGFGFDDNEEEDDETVETIVDAVMNRIVPVEEKGEETEFRARKALRTPKSFARPHQHMSHDQALEVLRRLGVKDVDEARAIFEKVNNIIEGGPGSGPKSGQKSKQPVETEYNAIYNKAHATVAKKRKWQNRDFDQSFDDEVERLADKLSSKISEMTTEGYPKKHKGRRKQGSKKRQAAKNRRKVRQKHK